MKKKNRFFIFASIILALFISLHSCSVMAQENMINQIPTITVPNDNSDIELKISELKIDIVIRGNIATTTFDVTFYNPLSRRLEGEFNFPLAEGQNISRYALEINGKMREGVVVEKKKARVAFENIVRRNIDPGLVEKTKGNNYKTRIYPIEANSYKRVIISFDETLDYSNKNLEYSLPISYTKSIEKFEINIKTLNQKVKPFIEKSGINNLNFDKWESGYFASLSKNNYTIKNYISFYIPFNNSDGSNLFVENSDNKTYFYYSTKFEKQEREKLLPKSIGIFWDVSASTNKRDIEKEISTLEKYLNSLENDIEVELIPFNIIKNKAERFKGSNRISNLLQKISNQKYDGGTQLGVLNFKDYNFDEILLFTDGLSTFGKEEVTLSDIPVITINSSIKANHSYLKYIAISTKGKYLNLSNLTTETAVKELKFNYSDLIKIDYNPNEFDEIYRSTDFNSNIVSIAGILKSDKANLKLHFGLSNTIDESKEIIISKDKATDDANIKKIWAQFKISNLNFQFEKNKELITQLGKDFSIVTENTSLLVLDRIEDYVEYEITPPIELQKEYYALLKNKHKKEEESKFAKFNQAISNLKETEAWWNKEFDQSKPKNILKNKDTNQDLLIAEDNDEMIPITRQEDVVSAPTSLIVEDDMEVDQDDAIEIVEFAEYEEVSDEVFFMVTHSDNQIREKSNDKFDSKIEVALWESDADYLTILKETSDNDIINKYYELQKKHYKQPSFYIDAAHYLYQIGLQDYSITVISNIAEMELENPELLRILGHFLLNKNKFELAIKTFQYVLKIREEEPQSYRDLALAYAENGQYQEAVEIYYKLINKVGHDRFPSITAIALNEMNNIIAIHSDKLDLSNIDKRLIYDLPIDIRIVINWSSNNSDVDLWVTDPYGEKCFYSNPQTRIGGKISKDITRGYGPEEFCLKNAIEGTYKIQVHYFGNSRQTISGPITVMAELYTNYGKVTQKKETILVRLTDSKQVIDIGQLVFD